jgi:hypothetical protein
MTFERFGSISYFTILAFGQLSNERATLTSYKKTSGILSILNLSSSIVLLLVQLNAEHEGHESWIRQSPS